MSATQSRKRSLATSKNNRLPLNAPACADERDSLLEQAFSHVQVVIPPLWPLADYVAVNPCVGLTDRSFLNAHLYLSSLRDCDLLMSRDYFRTRYSEGHLTADQIAAAHARCVFEYPDVFGQLPLSQLMKWLTESAFETPVRQNRFRTVADAVDECQGSTWSNHIISDITRHCAAHFDEGQATWSSPWKDVPLYTAWREATQLSRRMDLLGLKGFQSFVANLSAVPRRAVQDLLTLLEVPKSHWQPFLLCVAFSVAGWSSYVRYRVRKSETEGQENDDLIGLLAIRLAYDVALARLPGVTRPLPLWPTDADLNCDQGPAGQPSVDVQARYVLQVAAEGNYRQGLLRQLASSPEASPTLKRPLLQMVFCIDVRSEVLRRNIESVADSIETLGFAGSFGMPLEYIPFGATEGAAHCPALLRPRFQVPETLLDLDADSAHRIDDEHTTSQDARPLWKTFRTTAASYLKIASSFGWRYVGKLLSKSVHGNRHVSHNRLDGWDDQLKSYLGPDLIAARNHGLTEELRLELAEGMLRNLGLTSNFARVVILCGHGADVTNNPYRATLNCGACGGHSGKPNARVAGAILNDPQIRISLNARGISIPADTWFLPALHNTTTDVVELLDLPLVPPSHQSDITKIEDWLREAGRLSRNERGLRMASTDEADIFRRSRDWSEVQPEWGLAGNAAFIVAPRWRTVGMNFGGRTFLHNYSRGLDPELKVLESIMSAAMVVGNWINMQYYASAVDPVAFGSGNKISHNVVGQFGVLQGHGGDLKTGLPWQSVYDGNRLKHEPLRLLVVIDADRSSLQQVIERQKPVRDLVTNGWMSLIAWEGSDFYRWTAQATWQMESVVSD